MIVRSVVLFNNIRSDWNRGRENRKESENGVKERRLEWVKVLFVLSVLKILLQSAASLFNVNFESISNFVDLNLELPFLFDSFLKLFVQLPHFMLQLGDSLNLSLATLGGGNAISLALSILLFNLDCIHIDWLS